MMKCISITLVLLMFMKTSIPLFCYWNSGCPYKYFGSKTPYSYVRGDIRDSVIRLKGCEPVSIWGLYRHGKRQPAKKFLDKMKSVLSIQNHVEASYAAGRSSLCSQDVENLIQWKPDMSIFEQDCQITEDGLKEMDGLAKRLKQAFPKLLGRLKEGDYNFQSTFDLHTEKSLESFIRGLKNDNLTYQKAEGNYHYAVPFPSLKSYQNESRDEIILYAEVNKYFSNPEWLAMKDRIQRRTGILNLTDDSITTVYDLCRYNSSGFDNNLSPWCALFTTDDLLVLEYKDDLRHYYRHGYGNNNTEMFGRVALTNLLDNFKQEKGGNDTKIAVIISQATLLNAMYKALGLFKDDDALTAAHRDPSRKWRTAKQSTFSSNLVAVLNRCPENDAGEFNVVFYLNEEPLMSICKQGVCTWQEFEQKLIFHNKSLDFPTAQTERPLNSSV